jgi:hypothetical protein
MTSRARSSRTTSAHSCVRRAVVEAPAPAMAAALGGANKAAKNDVPDLMPVSHDGRARLGRCDVASLALPSASCSPCVHGVRRRPLRWATSRSSPSVRVPLDIGHQTKPADVRGVWHDLRHSGRPASSSGAEGPPPRRRQQKHVDETTGATAQIEPSLPILLGAAPPVGLRLQNDWR